MANNRILYVNPMNGSTPDLEDLGVYINLEVFKNNRSIIAQDNSGTSIKQDAGVSFKFIGNKDKSPITTDYTKFTTVFGGDSNIVESFGITDITIDFNTSFTPLININFVDLRGASLFELGSDSIYNVFFTLPYPIFKLTVKGYYGQAVTYCLHLTKFNSLFNSSTGNFEMNCQFIGYTYAFLSDILMGYLKAVPYTERGAELLGNTMGIDTFVKNIFKSEKSTEKIRNSNEVKQLEQSKTVLDLLKKYQTELESIKKLNDNSINNSDGKYYIKTDKIEDVKTISSNLDVISNDISSKIIESNVIYKNFYKEVDKYSNNIEFTNSENGSVNGGGNSLNFSIPIVKNILESSNAVNNEVKYKPLIGIESTSNSYIVIDIKEYEIKINNYITNLKNNITKLEKSISENISNTLTKQLGFRPTIKNVIGIFLKHTEALMGMIKETGFKAEGNKERSNKLIKTLKIDSDNGDVVYPFPLYTKNNEESYIGEDVTIEETELVEELINGMLKSKLYNLYMNQELDKTQYFFNPNILSNSFKNPFGSFITDLQIKNIDAIYLGCTIRAFNVSCGNVGYYSKDPYFSNYYEAIGCLDGQNIYSTLNMFDNNGSLTKLIKNEIDTYKTPQDFSDYIIKKLNSKNEIKFYSWEKSINREIIIGGSNNYYKFNYYSDGINTYLPWDLDKSTLNNLYKEENKIRSLKPVYELENNGEVLNNSFTYYGVNYNKKDVGNYFEFDSFESGNLPDLGELKYKNTVTKTSELKTIVIQGEGDYNPDSPDYTTTTKSVNYELKPEKNITGEIIYKENDFDSPGIKFYPVLYDNSNDNGIINLLNIKTDYLSDIKLLETNKVSTSIYFFKDVLNEEQRSDNLYYVQGTSNYSNFIWHSLCPCSNDRTNLPDSSLYNNIFNPIANNTIDTQTYLKNYYTNVVYGVYRNYNTPNIKKGSESFIGKNRYIIGKRGVFKYSVGDNKFSITKSTLPTAFTIGDNKIQLFGSELYMEQQQLGYDNANKIRAYLFLRSIPLHGNFNDFLGGSSYKEDLINGSYDYGFAKSDATDFVRDSLLANPGVQNVPYCWVLALGAEYWYRSSNLNIVLKNNLGEYVITGLNDNNKPIKGKKLITKEVLFSSMHNPNTLDDIDNIPNQFKSLCIEQFLDWIESSDNVSWLNIKSKFEIMNFNGKTIEKVREEWINNWKGFQYNINYVKSDRYNIFKGDDPNYIIFQPYVKDKTDFERIWLSPLGLNIPNDLKSSYRYDYNCVINHLNDDVNNLLFDFLTEDKPLKKGVGLNKHIYDMEEQPKIKQKHLKQYFEGFYKELKANFNSDVTQTKQEKDRKDELKQVLDSDFIRLNIYRILSAIYNKWLPASKDTGNNKDGCINHINLIDDFVFIDRAFNDISDKFIVNVSSLTNIIQEETNQNLYDFIGSRILAKNNMDFIALPSYIDFSKEEQLKKVFEPQILNNPDENLKVGPTFVCMYIGQRSQHLDLGEKGGFKDDGVDFNNEQKIFNADENSTRKIPVFQVNFGNQNQSIFKDIKLDQTEFSETDESLKITSDLVDNKNDKSIIAQDLYNVYSVRSYSAEITMMGCLQIQPYMYFQLNNIPMFKGGYMIIKTSHKIKPNSVETTFKGSRVRLKDTPLLTEEVVYKSILEDIVGSDSNNTKISLSEINESGFQNETTNIDTNFKLKNNGRVAQALEYFIGKGYPSWKAIGVISGLMGESGTELNSLINTESGAYGIAQWLDDRLRNLKTFYVSGTFPNDGGTTEKDFKIQLEFLNLELTKGNKFTDTTSVNTILPLAMKEGTKEAALAFMTTFERWKYIVDLYDGSYIPVYKRVLNEIKNKSTSDSSLNKRISYLTYVENLYNELKKSGKI